MIVHSELEALRSDDAPQRRTQAALKALTERWRGGADFAPIETEFGRYAAGEPLSALPALTELFRPDSSVAERISRSLVAPMATFLADHPLGQVSLRHYADGQSATLVLCHGGGSLLSIQAHDPIGLARQRAATAASFTPGETRERVMAGSGEADLITLRAQLPDRAVLIAEPRLLAAGDCQYRDGAVQCQIIHRIDAPLVLLKLQRRNVAGSLTREFALSDGRFLAQAAATPRETRLELFAALLGRMGRRDAAPLLAAMAEEEAGQSLRWQSLKECLALDSATGFAALCRIAASTADPLAPPAGALRAQLIETYPELERLTSCRE